MPLRAVVFFSVFLRQTFIAVVESCSAVESIKPLLPNISAPKKQLF
jgi:hypothetical protein